MYLAYEYETRDVGRVWIEIQCLNQPVAYQGFKDKILQDKNLRVLITYQQWSLLVSYSKYQSLIITLWTQLREKITLLYSRLIQCFLLGWDNLRMGNRKEGAIRDFCTSLFKILWRWGDKLYFTDKFKIKWILSFSFSSLTVSLFSVKLIHVKFCSFQLSVKLQDLFSFHFSWEKRLYMVQHAYI